MIASLLPSLTFLHPWLLWGLAGLPALWWILRVTPPPPRTVDFPAAHFLIGLIGHRTYPKRTPWWILLLRLCIAALTIAALAHPVHNAGKDLEGSGPLRLIVDNGWESAQSWAAQMNMAKDVLSRAARQQRSVMLLATAPSANEPLKTIGPAPPLQIENALRGLSPQPWPADYKALAKAIENPLAPHITTFWLSSGIGAQGADTLAQRLEDQGDLILFSPSPSDLPLLIRPPESTVAQSLSARIVASAQTPPGRPVTLEALDEKGRVLDTQSLRIGSAGTAAVVTFEMPDMLRNTVSRVRISGHNGAGAILLLDEGYRRRSVGLVETSGETGGKTPFIGADYYLSRALSPFAEIVQGSVDAVLDSSPSLLILPDMGGMPPSMLERLEKWLRAGGTLVRFAGPKMAASPETFLTPVPLRSDDRAQGGAMSWDKPLHLAPFPEDSPLNDLPVPKDVTIRQQILAASPDDLDGKVWARLEDGTPLVTASREGSGLLVLVHTTATPEWSDFALSGTFVSMLRKLVALSASPANVSASRTAADVLHPERVLDGQGALVRPSPSVQPLSARSFAQTLVSPIHPPGYYGSGGTARALNLGAAIASLPPLPQGINAASYGTRYETDLMPSLLTLALILFLLDWAVMMALSRSLSLAALIRGAGAPWTRFQASKTEKPAKRSANALRSFAFLTMGAAFACVPLPSHASASPSRLAGDFHLAYVRSGSDSLDNITAKGLEALSETLRARTSVEPGDVVAVDPDRDDLSFFPILYWCVTPQAAPLTDKALSSIQRYLNQGGTILFDMRDAGARVDGWSTTPGASALKRTVGALDIPALVPLPQNHVLTRSFYLLDSFPGRYEGGTLWVESQSVSGRDGVSSVIVGGNDWAAAWAESVYDSPTRQQEIALRFGINLVMYALTGNYKADQVHIPHILQRLERRQ